MNKTKALFTLTFLLANTSLAAACKLTYFSQSHFETQVNTVPELRDFSKTVNNLMKKSFNTLEKLDDATLGLVSAIATGGTPIYKLRPEQWDKIHLNGNLIYQDMPFSGTPLKGVKITFSEDKNSRTITTGSYGEFAESFSKLIPFKRLTLFPVPTFEMGKKSVPTIKIPIQVKVESNICNGETTIQEVPIEPLVFILSKSE